jgi:hypothetical protein
MNGQDVSAGPHAELLDAWDPAQFMAHGPRFSAAAPGVRIFINSPRLEAQTPVAKSQVVFNSLTWHGPERNAMAKRQFDRRPLLGRGRSQQEKS